MREVKVQKYKIDAVAELQADFEKTQSFIFTDYRGLSVQQISDLRTSLRAVGAEFHVVKNTYARIAFSQLNHEEIAPCLVGPTAIAYCGDEAGPVAKVLLKLGKEMSVLVKGGLLDGHFCDAKMVESFSKLPTKIELVQMLMSTMQAPVSNVVYVLNGVNSQLVRTLHAIAEKKSQEGQ